MARREKRQGVTSAIVPGSDLGTYKIVEKVGEGGMAAVYKAYQASLSRFVAIKILPAQFATDPDFQTRFREEAVAVAAMRHPNILAVHDFGEIDGVTFIVNEFVDGGTLEQQMGKALPVSYVTEMLMPIASALDYAHSRGLIHRDVKPSNILITREGRPMLADFGLARMMMPDRNVTQTGMILGTPAYMAPEQGQGEAVPASDIYSLGIVAFQALTGRVPYKADTPLAIVLAHQVQPLPMPRSLNPDISEGVEGVLLKGLARAPEDRYPTAEIMVKALRSPGRRGGKSRRAAAAGAAAAGAAAAGATVADAGATVAAGGPPPPPPPPPPRGPGPAVASPIPAGVPPRGPTGTTAAPPPRSGGNRGIIAAAIGFFGVALLSLLLVLVFVAGVLGSQFQLVGQKRNQAQPQQQQQPPQQPSPQPSVAARGTEEITLSPSSGAAAASFTVSGINFDPGEIVEIVFSTMLIGQPKADDKGSFGPTPAQVPDFFGHFTGTNSYDVSATGKKSGKHARAPFKVSA